MSNTNISELKENLSQKIFSQLPNTGFPVEVFPKEIQEIIQKAHHELGYPIEYLSCSILFAASVAIGKSLKVQVKPGWLERAILWLGLVGNPGTNKSHPLSFALHFFENLDKENYKIYRELLDSWRKKPKKEREDIEPPIWSQRLVSDITLESLIQVLDRNPKGVGLYQDELMAWILNQTRYNTGSETEAWLSLFSGKSIRINRKTEAAGNFYISDPFSPVCGTIQPNVLQSLFAGNRGNNGFADRFLFCFPENLIAESWQVSTGNNEARDCLSNIISKIDSLPVTSEKYLCFSPNADKIRIRWFNSNRRLLNEANKDGNVVSNFYAKLDSYYHRFSLIIEALYWACNESDLSYITEKSATKAEKITEYFRKENQKIFSLIATKGTDIEKFTELEKKVFQALEDSFETAEGVSIAKDLGMPERTFKRFLAKSFRKIRHGEYCKK